MNAVPEIDIFSLFEDTSARRKVASAIGGACEKTGFLAISGHGVDEKLIDNAQRVGREFFRLPPEAKERIARKPPQYFRGYVGLSTEGLSRTAGSGAADLKEAFAMGPIDVLDTPYYIGTEGKGHFEPNRWPAHPTEFRVVMEEYYRAMTRLSERLMCAFALALDLPEDWFVDKIDRSISNIRLNYYPAQDEPPNPGEMRAGAHTDFGSLTILLTEMDSSGLQVLDFNNEWVDIPSRPGQFVVNIGDLMAQWTNDRFVSTLHRVCNPNIGDRSDRLSIAFIQQPNYDAVIECIPTCLRLGEKPRYRPTTSGAHRRRKLEFAKTETVS